MRMLNIQSNKMTFILGSKDYKVIYSSMDNRFTEKYIEKLNILDSLHEDLPFHYTKENYHVKIDKFIILDEVYNIVTASLQVEKCENCFQASIDSVTGLYNRNYFEKFRTKETCLDINDTCLILIDIDNLKKINDSHGHLIGDKAIEIVGQAIRNSIRKEDIGIRYGGDEFLVIIFDQDKSSLAKVVDRIREEINRINIEEDISVNISTGIAHCSCSEDLEKMIKIADVELYKEKRKKEIQDNPIGG